MAYAPVTLAALIVLAILAAIGVMAYDALHEVGRTARPPDDPPDG